MKVGIVAAEMEGARTGVGRYLEGLLTGLESWDHGIEWHLFFQGRAVPEAVRRPGFISHESNDRGNRVVWEHLRLPKELEPCGLDAVFCPAYTVPFGLKIPSVVSIHDLSFEEMPGEFGFRERWRRRYLARRAARVADRVLTDTRHMADLVARRYRIPDARMAVVPLGVDRKRFVPRAHDDDCRRIGALGVRSPYLLWLGTVLERRQPRAVLEAFSALRVERPDLHLVIAGANRMRSPQRLGEWIGELGLEAHAVQLGYVEEQDLAPLYRGAAAGVYVSQHEGFGIPPLECLACGTPVVISSGQALDEVWPDYPNICENLSSSSIATALNKALSSRGWGDGLASEAEELVRGLDWTASSRGLVAELEVAVSL